MKNRDFAVGLFVSGFSNWVGAFHAPTTSWGIACVLTSAVGLGLWVTRPRGVDDRG